MRPPGWTTTARPVWDKASANVFLLCLDATDERNSDERSMQPAHRVPLRRSARGERQGRRHPRLVGSAPERDACAPDPPVRRGRRQGTNVPEDVPALAMSIPNRNGAAARLAAAGSVDAFAIKVNA